MPDSRWRTAANTILPASVRGPVRARYHSARALLPRPFAAASFARLGIGRLGDLSPWLRDGCKVPPVDVRTRQMLYELLATNPIEVAVETGTLRGDTTAFLARHCTRVVTIELSADLAARARTRFASTPGVEVVEGDSGRMLAEVLATVDEPALFWLDGHWSGDGTARGAVDCPLLAELETIGRWPHALRSVVAIDDAVRFGDDPGYPTLAETKAFADRIGWDCFTMQNDVIVLHPFPQPGTITDP